MKELVEQHIRKVSKIENFSSSDVDVDVILQALYQVSEIKLESLAWYVLKLVFQAMWELKSHEYIENHYIMDTLKARLQARRVRSNSINILHIYFIAFHRFTTNLSAIAMKIQNYWV